MTAVAAETDELRHAEWTANGSWQTHQPLTVCGKRIAGPPAATARPCHVCFPAEAHPLAAVWEQCRRIDNRLNADIVRSMPATQQKESSDAR